VIPLALAVALLAASPLQAEQPSVRQGNKKLVSGDAAGALEHYQAAEQEAGPHPEIDFDRGDALHAQGRHAEAVEAWKKALERDKAGPLSSRALQNTGNALDSAGDREGAQRAFAEALRRDPGNEDARYNLEVLLRRKASAQQQPKDQGDQGKKDQQDQPQPGQGKPDQPQAGQGKQDQPQRGKDEQGAQEQQSPQRPGQQGAKEERARDQGQQPAQQGRPGGERTEKPGEAAGRPAEADRQHALRLLDALRARERQMPLEPAARKDGRRRDVEKDW
jgi:Ca-activated chloride channel family protein